MELQPNTDYRLESRGESIPVSTDESGKLNLDQSTLDPRRVYRIRGPKVNLKFRPDTFNEYPMLLIRDAAQVLYHIRNKKEILDGYTDENGILVINLKPGQTYRVFNNQGFRKTINV